MRGGGSAATIEAGQSAQFEVETMISGVGNAEAISVPLEFGCESGDSRVKCSLNRSEATLAAGESQQVAVQVQVPGRSRKSVRLRNSVPPGEYYVTFVAKSGEETRSVRLGFRVK